MRVKEISNKLYLGTISLVVLCINLLIYTNSKPDAKFGYGTLHLVDHVPIIWCQANLFMSSYDKYSLTFTF